MFWCITLGIRFTCTFYMYICLVCISHYFVNGGWFPKDGYLLDNVDAVRHIPATIVQGRYDAVAPMKTAWELHKVSICKLLHKNL